MSKIDSRIALVITDQETNAQIKNLGVGLLELRVDFFKKLDPAYIIKQIKHRRSLKIPLLLTLRNHKHEGATHEFSDELKMQIIHASLSLVDMVDIELSSPLFKQVMSLARKLGKKVIVSSHFLRGTPKDLDAIFKRTKSLIAGASHRGVKNLRSDIVKIAAKANSFDDVMSMLSFAHRHRKQNIIAMSLGPVGSISRLIMPAAGSRYTYTFLKRPAASGQIDVHTLRSHMKMYGFDALHALTSGRSKLSR